MTPDSSQTAEAERNRKAMERLFRRIEEDSLYMRDALGTLWRGRALIGLVVLVCLLIGLVWLKAQTPLYAATMTIGPVPTNEDSSGSSVGGLGSVLTGLSLGGEQSITPYQEYQQLLISTATAHLLQQKYHLLQREFPNSWDAANNRWREPSGPRHWIGAGLRGIFGLPGWRPPGDNTVLDYLQDNVSSTSVAQTSMRDVRVLDRDPAVALWLLQTLNREVDNIIRRDTQQRTSAQIAYLDAKLPKISNVMHLEAIARLLSNQEQTLMMTQINAFYSVRVIGSPTVSDTPVSPKAPLVIALSILTGLVLGILLLLILNMVGNARHPGTAPTVLVTASKVGGLEALIVEVARGLAEQGAQVTLALPRDAFELIEFAAAENFKIITFAASHSILHGLSWRWVVTSRWAEYDCIYSLDSSMPMVFRGPGLRAATFTSETHKGGHVAPRPLSFLRRFNARRMDHVIADPAGARQLIASALPPDRVSVVPAGVDVSRFVAGVLARLLSSRVVAASIS